MAEFWKFASSDNGAMLILLVPACFAGVIGIIKACRGESLDPRRWF